MTWIQTAVGLLLLLAGEPLDHPVWGKRQLARAVMHAYYNYDVPPALLLAVAIHESRMNPRARGGIGEVGLWQLHPQYHARGLRELCGLEPAQCAGLHAARAASWLRQGYEICGTWEGALVTYNRGHGCHGRREYVSRVLREWRYVESLVPDMSKGEI